MAFDGDACRVDDDSGAVGCFGPVEGVAGYLDVAADSPSKRLVRLKKEPEKFECKTWPNTVHLRATSPFPLSLLKGRDSANRLRQAQPERLSEQY